MSYVVDSPPKFEELLEDAKECQKMKKDEFTFRDDKDKMNYPTS